MEEFFFDHLKYEEHSPVIDRIIDLCLHSYLVIILS